MARWRGTTTERGYGSEHARLRAKWKPAVDAGRAFCHAIVCLKPDRWIPPGTPWHLGHTPDRTAWTGPEHEHCGSADGARRGNQRRQFTPAASTGASVICRACGQPYHYAARACEMCGAHYHPSYGQQRTCSRPCGVQLQRRNRMAAGWIPKDQRPKPERQPQEPKNGWPATAVAYYTCRYCGKIGVQRAAAKPGHGAREVCEARICQLARRAVNNLCAREGLNREQADAQVIKALASGRLTEYGGAREGQRSWSRQW